MSIHIYICIYICMCVYIFIYTYTHVSTKNHTQMLESDVKKYIIMIWESICGHVRIHIAFVIIYFGLQICLQKAIGNMRTYGYRTLMPSACVCVTHAYIYTYIQSIWPCIEYENMLNSYMKNVGVCHPNIFHLAKRRWRMDDKTEHLGLLA